MPETSGTAHRLFRQFVLGSGPLKRGSDRLQVLARVLLVLALLTAIPIALAVVTAAYSHGQTVAAAEAADRHQVPAKLLDDPTTPADSGITNAEVVTANVIWTDPSGAARKGVLAVPGYAKAGSTVTIWVGRDGDIAGRPDTSSDVVAQAIGIGIVTLLFLSLGAIGAYLLFRMQLDRSRLRRWATDWAVVEPVWTGKVP
jgi:hypothetical protein